MSRGTSIGTSVFVVASGTGIFLVSQGLGKASSWAAVIGLPLTAVGVIAGVWTAILTRRILQGPRRQATAELSDAASNGVSKSGKIRQKNTDGITIAHTGSGDVDVRKTGL
jgi:hypothetical protein